MIAVVVMAFVVFFVVRAIVSVVTAIFMFVVVVRLVGVAATVENAFDIVNVSVPFDVVDNVVVMSGFLLEEVDVSTIVVVMAVEAAMVLVAGLALVFKLSVLVDVNMSVLAVVYRFNFEVVEIFVVDITVV